VAAGLARPQQPHTHTHTHCMGPRGPAGPSFITTGEMTFVTTGGMTFVTTGEMTFVTTGEMTFVTTGEGNKMMRKHCKY